MTTENNGLYSLWRGGEAYRKVIAQQMQSFIDGEVNAVSQFEKLASDWCERRREGLKSVSELTESMAAVNNIGELWSLGLKWTNEELARLSEDATGVSQRFMSLGEKARDAATTLTQNWQTAGVEIGNQMKNGLANPFDAMKGNGHAVPAPKRGAQRHAEAAA